MRHSLGNTEETVTMAGMAMSSYPITLGLARPLGSSRFFAIPIIGLLVKGIILIPHFIILYVLAYVVALANLVIWIPVLFTGQYPGWAHGLVAGYLRWAMRVYLYLFGVTDTYPSFSTDAPGDIVIARPESSSRFFAIPFVGAIVRGILLIPHLIILYVLGFVVAACQLVIWIPVLFMGQYPGWAFTLVAGTVLWGTRVYSYFLGLTDRYPPFSFE